eukprot:2552395-Lingulodinium_polyedra.AAC.1
MGIEGPVCLVRRRSDPRYYLVVCNQLDADGLIDAPHGGWVLDSDTCWVAYWEDQAGAPARG